MERLGEAVQNGGARACRFAGAAGGVSFPGAPPVRERRGCDRSSYPATDWKAKWRPTMSYSIIEDRKRRETWRPSAKAGVEVGLANTKGAEAVKPLAWSLAARSMAKSLDEALKADVIILAVPFLNFKTSVRCGLTGPERSSSTSRTLSSFSRRSGTGSCRDVSRRRSTPGACRARNWLKAFNQLPMGVLSGPVPGGGRRVVFVASDHPDASATVARLAEELGFAPIEVGKIAEGGRLIQARNALVFQDLVNFGK